MVSTYSTRPMDCGVLAMNKESNELMSKHNRPYTLSMVMIVKNEAENLKVSLPAVADWVDEMIVLDSGSTDNSEEIAKQYGAKWFVNTDWQGFGKQKQLAQSYAKGDWILALDADEEVSLELKESILTAIQKKPADVVYGLRRIDYIFGHPVDNAKWLVSLKPYWRLYPKKFSFNENMVHESLDITLTKHTIALAGYLYHHTAPCLYHLFQKRLDYAKVWADEAYGKNKKTNILAIMGHSFWNFLRVYFLEGRFLLGTYGLIYACIFTQYTFNKYVILYHLNNMQGNGKTN